MDKARLKSFDFSLPEVEGVTFESVEDTSYYRPERSYKIFTCPGGSKAVLTFDIPKGSSYVGVCLRLNHCRTTAHGTIDVTMNGSVLMERYALTPRDNFGTQEFVIDSTYCCEGSNSIEIRLNADSPGVYWLSDGEVDLLTHELPPPPY